MTEELTEEEGSEGESHASSASDASEMDEFRIREDDEIAPIDVKRLELKESDDFGPKDRDDRHSEDKKERQQRNQRMWIVPIFAVCAVIFMWVVLLPPKEKAIAKKPGVGTYPELSFEEAEWSHTLSDQNIDKLLERHARRRRLQEKKNHNLASTTAQSVGGAYASGIGQTPENRVHVSADNFRPSAELPKRNGKRRRRSRVRRKRTVETAKHVETQERKRAQFFSPGGTIDMVSTANGGGTLDELSLAVGQRIRATLEVGITSSHNEQVLAKVSKDVVQNGRTVLNKGDMLVGRARNDNDRMYIRFRTIHTAGKVMKINGYAVKGKLPGIPARKTTASLGEKNRSGVVGGTLDFAKDLAGTAAGGGLAGRLAGNIARESVPDLKKEVEPDISVILSVPAGTSFQIVVTEGA